MASSRVQGITVEIGGNTKGLNKAIDSVNRTIGNTQSQLKDVEKLLKLDPTNTKLLEQRQRLLGEAVSQTKSKLDTLKTAEKQVQEQFNKGDISRDQYDRLQREIIETEQNLRNLEKTASKSNATISGISAAADKVSSTASGVSKATAPITAAAIGIGAAAFKMASDMEESVNKVNVAFGDSAEAVTAFAESSLQSFGIAEGTALEMASTFGDMGTSMGLTQKDAADMAVSLTGLAGDLSSFKNIGVDQAMTALNGIFTGETESLKGLGVVMTQTNLDAFALANGFNKTTAEMSEAEKVQLRYQYVMQATQNAQGDFARTSDGAANSMRILQESTKEVSAEFGAALLPAITPIIQKATELIQWFGSLDQSQKNMILTVVTLIAAISPVAGIVSGIASAISFLVANPIVLLIAAIVGLVVLIATKGEEIKGLLGRFDEFLQNIFLKDWTEVFGAGVGDVLNGFFANVKNVWSAIKTVLTGVIDFIQNVFQGNWQAAWEGIKQIFRGIFEGIVASAKAPLNGIIALLNGAISGINSLLQGLNKIQVNIPSWVPGIGGKAFGINIPNIPSIPYLAKGGTVLNGSAIVGEAGPELLTVTPQGTRVQPLSASGTTKAGAMINIDQITFYGYTSQQGRELVRDLNRQLGKVYT